MKNNTVISFSHIFWSHWMFHLSRHQSQNLIHHFSSHPSSFNCKTNRFNWFSSLIYAVHIFFMSITSVETLIISNRKLHLSVKFLFFFFWLLLVHTFNWFNTDARLSFPKLNIVCALLKQLFNVYIIQPTYHDLKISMTLLCLLLKT